MLHPILAPICLHPTMLHATNVSAAMLVTLDAESYAASNTGNNFSASKTCK